MKARREKLMHYMLGWKAGATGSATSKEIMEIQEFREGHDDGRKAVGAAYLAASERYQAKLDPLRAGPDRCPIESQAKEAE